MDSRINSFDASINASTLWGERVVMTLYSVTFLFGLAGNVWVLSSVWRSRQLNSPAATKSSPSSRLRTYIGLLAFVDMLVTLSLLFRLILVVHPQAGLDSLRCQSIHVVDQWVKAASLGCLACISIERYVTIRKPFSSATRKRLVMLAPLAVLFVLLLSLVAMFMQAWDLGDIESGLNCGVPSGLDASAIGPSITFDVTSWLLACIFLAFLATITVNYAQIVRHVKRKFKKRKCHSYENQLRRLSVALLTPSRASSEYRSGGVVSSTLKNQVKAKLIPLPLPLSPSVSNAAPRMLTPLPEPRYMRDMTAIIVRIAVFHAVCWLPYCLMQLMPYRFAADGSGALKSASTNVRFVEHAGATTHHDFHQVERGGGGGGEDGWVNWMELVADWLTYVNSAGDWILYAAMNRELRSLIKANSERRKRSAFSQFSPQNSPNLLRSSLQKQVTVSLRLFYSINSFRSSADTDAPTTPRPNSRATPKMSLSPSLGRGSSRGSRGSADGEQNTLLSKKSFSDIGLFGGGWWTSDSFKRGRNSNSSETKSVFNYAIVPPTTPVNEKYAMPEQGDIIV